MKKLYVKLIDNENNILRDENRKLYRRIETGTE